VGERERKRERERFYMCDFPYKSPNDLVYDLLPEVSSK
jgi:hypothetical protein